MNNYEISCPYCFGEGKQVKNRVCVRKPTLQKNETYVFYEDCDRCNGSGKINADDIIG